MTFSSVLVAALKSVTDLLMLRFLEKFLLRTGIKWPKSDGA